MPDVGERRPPRPQLTSRGEIVACLREALGELGRRLDALEAAPVVDRPGEAHLVLSELLLAETAARALVGCVAREAHDSDG